MKIKLDENVHGDLKKALQGQGHDVQTVHDEGLAGKPDVDISAAIRDEARCLVTFDLDFSDPRSFDPREHAGLIVLRLRAPTAQRQIDCVVEFLTGKTDLAGQLWILEDNRARDWTP